MSNFSEKGTLLSRRSLKTSLPVVNRLGSRSRLFHMNVYALDLVLLVL